MAATADSAPRKSSTATSLFSFFLSVNQNICERFESVVKAEYKKIEFDSTKRGMHESCRSCSLKN